MKKAYRHRMDAYSGVLMGMISIEQQREQITRQIWMEIINQYQNHPYVATLIYLEPVFDQWDDTVTIYFEEVYDSEEMYLASIIGGD